VVVVIHIRPKVRNRFVWVAVVVAVASVVVVPDVDPYGWQTVVVVDVVADFVDVVAEVVAAEVVDSVVVVVDVVCKVSCNWSC